jgi:hypothetical protein
MVAISGVTGGFLFPQQNPQPEPEPTDDGTVGSISGGNSTGSGDTSVGTGTAGTGGSAAGDGSSGGSASSGSGGSSSGSNDGAAGSSSASSGSGSPALADAGSGDASVALASSPGVAASGAPNRAQAGDAEIEALRARAEAPGGTLDKNPSVVERLFGIDVRAGVSSLFQPVQAEPKLSVEESSRRFIEAVSNVQRNAAEISVDQPGAVTTEASSASSQSSGQGNAVSGEPQPGRFDRSA